MTVPGGHGVISFIGGCDIPLEVNKVFEWRTWVNPLNRVSNIEAGLASSQIFGFSFYVKSMTDALVSSEYKGGFFSLRVGGCQSNFCTLFFSLNKRSLLPLVTSEDLL